MIYARHDFKRKIRLFLSPENAESSKMKNRHFILMAIKTARAHTIQFNSSKDGRIVIAQRKSPKTILFAQLWDGIEHTSLSQVSN